MVHFQILEEIGQEGRNSQVFKINDTALNAEMVLKKICKRSFATPEQYFDEARMLYNVQHPNVVEVNYSCQDQDFVYITMPFYQKGSLSNLMSHKLLTVREIIRYTVQFLSGLHHIHSSGLLHFDLKPDNILLSERDEAMLSDFGLAKYMDEYGFTRPNGFYRKHLAPEAVAQPQFSAEFDIYQAGLTIYRMCIGSSIFNAQYAAYFEANVFNSELFSEDLTSGRFPDRNVYPEHIPSKLKSVVNKCLEVNPEDRYPSAIEVVNAISDIDESYLDWRPSVEGDIRKWSKKSATGTLYCIDVDANNRSTAYKISASGRRTSITKYTKIAIGNRELNRFFKGK